jgi:hypothetical protein
MEEKEDEREEETEKIFKKESCIIDAFLFFYFYFLKIFI